MSDMLGSDSDLKYKPEDNAELSADLWLAVQYVLGELSNGEAEAFETSVVEDEALCDALILASQLTSGIAVAFDAAHSSRPDLLDAAEKSGSSRGIVSTRRVDSVFGVIAATVAMALAIFAMAAVRNTDDVRHVAAVDDATAEMLATLLQNAGANEVGVEIEEVNSSDDSVSSLVAPEWLMTAVDLEAGGLNDEVPVIGPDDESGVY